MEKIRLEDMELIAGVEWTALPAELPEKKALAEYLSKSKAKRGVVLRYHGVTVVGRVDGKPGKVPSATALLALASQKSIEESGMSSSDATTDEHNWIVIEPISGEQDKFWMGAVKNGVPLPGGDIVGTRHKVIEEMLDIITTNSNFTVFTLDKEVRYNALGQVNVLEKRFVDLIRGVPTKKAQMPLFSIAAILAVVVFGLAFVLIGGWLAFSKWDEKQRAEAARLAALQQQKAQAAQVAANEKLYENEIKKAVLKGLEEGMSDIKTTLESSSPLSTIQAWRDLIYAVDLDQSGWELQRADCFVEENVPKCNIVLRRGEMGVNRMLLEDHPDAVITGDDATYVVASQQALSPRGINMHAMGSGIDFEKSILSELQMLRSLDITHQVAQSKDVVKEVKIPAEATVLSKASEVAPGAAPEPPKPISVQLGFGSGTLSISGKQLWQMMGVAKYIDGANVRVKDMTVNLAQAESSAWTVNTDYLVRTLPQPVIPVVRIGEKNVIVPLPEEYKSQVPVTEGGVGESTITSTAPAESAEQTEQGGEAAP